jgi:glycosyl transferase family 87
MHLTTPLFRAAGRLEVLRTRLKPLKRLLIAVCIAQITFNVLALRGAWASLPRFGDDFSAYYAAARLILEGQRSSLYNPRAQQEMQTRLFHRDSLLPFIHPAYEIPVFLPFGLAPYYTARRMWMLLSVGLLIAAGLAMRKVSSGLGEVYLNPLLALLAFFPATLALLHGQDSIILLLLLVLAFRALKRRDDLAAGILLAFGLFRFQIVVPLVFPFVVRRRWRVLGGFAGAGFALASLPILFTGPHGVTDYLRLLSIGAGGNVAAGLRGYDWTAAASMPNLRGAMFGLAHVAGLGAPKPWMIFLPSVALLLWTASRIRFHQPEALPLEFSLAIVTALLVSYHLYLYDLALLILLLLLPAGRARVPTWLLGIFFLTPTYLLLGNVANPLLVCPMLLLVGWLSINHPCGPSGKKRDKATFLQLGQIALSKCWKSG